MEKLDPVRLPHIVVALAAPDCGMTRELDEFWLSTKRAR
jgi:hypothetical protein